MSNIGVITLESTQIRPQPGLCAARLQIEDNIGEAIHIHWRNWRLDFSIRDFLALAAACGQATKKIGDEKPPNQSKTPPDNQNDVHGQSPQHASSGTREISLDKDFINAMGEMINYIARAKIEQRYLDDLACLTYTSIDPYRCYPTPIVDSKPFRGLQGHREEYEVYASRFGEEKHNFKNLMELKRSIEIDGYPHQDRYIVVFADQPYIRDGQHRAAVLKNLYGNIKIPVLRIDFVPSYEGWRMQDIAALKPCPSICAGDRSESNSALSPLRSSLK